MIYFVRYFSCSFPKEGEVKPFKLIMLGYMISHMQQVDINYPHIPYPKVNSKWVETLRFHPNL